MRRREVIALLGGAHAWPMTALAQAAPTAPTPVIGFVNSGSPGPFAHLAAGFRKGLAEEGLIEGRNVTIVYRWAEGDYDRLPALVNDLVRQNVAVLAATGGAMTGLASKSATHSTPIVFVMGGDPVQLGLVASLNKPGGNITGVTQLTIELAAKRFELLRELVPQLKRIAVLFNPNFSETQPQLHAVQAAAARAALEAVILRASRETELAGALATLEQKGVEALIVGADPFFNTHRHQIVALVARQRMPTIYDFREFTEAGGLLSYGTDLADAYRLAGTYVGRVLNGARPADLPVVQAARFEMVINLITAKTLGLDIPPSLLARADEVIE